MTKDDKLLALMSKYGFVLPRNAIEWRPKAIRGQLPSLLVHSCTLIATDGIVAYFVLGDDKTLFYGHLAAFEEFKDEPERRAKPERKVSKRQALYDSI